MDNTCSIYVAKTRPLISCTVTAHLICAFVFAYAKTSFLIMRLKYAIRLCEQQRGITICKLVPFEMADWLESFFQTCQTLASILSEAGFFEFSLVGKAKDKLSRNKAKLCQFRNQ